jgi:hypothetical protein
MSFKFLVGQAVEYTPIGEKKPGLFKIVRQMPMEDQAIDVYYRIKSETENHERNVAECHLTPDVGADSAFASVNPADNDGIERDQNIPS